MASYVMHLAIAEEYLKKHPEENKEEFIEGTIAPDQTTDKSLTHYGKHAAWSSPYKYLLENGKSIENGFKRGYFLHLITDYLFYHKLINIDQVLEELGMDEWIKRQRNDFCVINDEIIEKYDLTIPEIIKGQMTSKEGEMMIFDKTALYNFLEELADTNLDKMAEELLKNQETDLIKIFEKVNQKEKEEEER